MENEKSENLDIIEKNLASSASMIKNARHEDRYHFDLKMGIEYARRAIVEMIGMITGQGPDDQKPVGGCSSVYSEGGCLAAVCGSGEPIDIFPYKNDHGGTSVILTSYDITGVDQSINFQSELIPDIIKQLQKIHEESDR